MGRSLLLRGGTLWDGQNPDVRRDADILVEDGRIVAVGADAAGSDAAVLDLEGRYVLPGLIDMHVHLVWSGSPDPAALVEREGEQLTTIRAVANAQAQVRAGVTTVRDLGGNADIAVTVAGAVDKGLVEGPSIVAAGQSIIMTGGHDPFWGLASDGVDAVVRSVRRQVSIGARVIKLAATGGVYGRPEGEDVGQTELNLDELTAAVREAHRFGLKVAAHALGTEGIRNAVLAGVDTVEHGNFLTEEIVDLMRRNGTALCPTLAIYRTIADGPDRGVPSYAADKAQRAVAAHMESFAMAREAGIPIVAGTDAGSCATPHPALVGELSVMCELGMPAHDALRAATSTAADVLGRADCTGRIAPGLQADLLVVNDDPREDVRVLLEPYLVLRAGRTPSKEGQSTWPAPQTEST